MRVIVGETPRADEYHCWMGDLDISRWCFAADDEEGWADIFVVDEYGKVQVCVEDDVTFDITKDVTLATVRWYGPVRLAIP